MNKLAASSATTRRQVILTFRLGGQTYALPIASVVKIVEISDVSFLPRARAPVTGMITENGARIPLIDLRACFGLPEVGIKPRAPVLIVEAQGCPVGLLVDEVADVSNPADAWYADAGELHPGTIVITPHGKALLLDWERFFSADQVKLIAAQNS